MRITYKNQGQKLRRKNKIQTIHSSLVSGEVLDFSEEEELQFKCANNFESFLEAFILLIKLETEINDDQEINDPAERLEEIVQAAGGEGYKDFYEFIFPIDILQKH